MAKIRQFKEEIKMPYEAPAKVAFPPDCHSERREESNLSVGLYPSLRSG
jgi:hypothetical protein